MQKKPDWRDVKISCGFGIFLETEEEAEAREPERAKITRDTRESIREVLRQSFSGGPEQGARAQAAYRDWRRAGGETPIPAGARKWLQYKDRWLDHVWNNITTRFATFDETDSIDFKPALRRSRSRGRSM